MNKQRLWIGVAVATLVIASPVLLIVAILLELAVFGTRHISGAADSVGLTPFLQNVFTTLGING